MLNEAVGDDDDDVHDKATISLFGAATTEGKHQKSLHYKPTTNTRAHPTSIFGSIQPSLRQQGQTWPQM